jgi:hypothetical protein
MKNSRRSSRLPTALMIFVLLLNMALIGVTAYSLTSLRGGVESAHQRGEEALEMVLGTYTLRQSSDYLTRFARQYAVTGDPAWRDVYQQVLDIRRGDALRPKDYESVYWDLIEPYRSNAHPLLFPQSLRTILETLPFTPGELELLKRSEDNSEELAQVELTAFQAVEEGRRDEAVEALFSVDYQRAKHAIMQPIDELMIGVRRRIEEERGVSLARDNQRVEALLAGAAVVLLIDLLALLRLARGGRRRPPPESDEASLDRELPVSG